MALSFFRILYAIIGFICLSAFAQEIEAVPFQSLQTPQGLKISFLENEKTSFLHLSIGFKPLNYLTPREKILTNSIVELLQERVHLLLKEKPKLSISFRIAPVIFEELLTVQIKAPPEQLDFALAVVRQCLSPFSISASELKAGITRQIKILNARWQHVQADPKQLAKYHVIRLMSPFPGGVPQVISELRRIRIKELAAYSYSAIDSR